MTSHADIDALARADYGTTDNSQHHALSWSSILGGAFIICSLDMILLLLGFGLGLSSVSPWSPRGIGTSALADGAIAWLVLSQCVAGGMGGYLAGRLRHRWSRVHRDEVHFRDTAQGFLAWAVSLIVMTGFLTSASTGLVGAGPYSMGMRAPLSSARLAERQALASTGAVTPSDDMDVKLEIDADRKAAAYTALWLFVALLGGAFCASLFATVGGRHRDHLYPYSP